MKLNLWHSLLAFNIVSFLFWNVQLSRIHWVVSKWAWKKLKSLSRVWLFATPWTAAYQAPPSMGFSRQEYWSGLPFPSPGDLPNPGIKSRSLALQTDALPSEPPGKPKWSWEPFKTELLTRYAIVFNLFKVFSRWLSGKESTYKCRRFRRLGFNPWVKKIPWRKTWQPSPVLLPENPMNRGAWRAIVHGCKVRYDWAHKYFPPLLLICI